MKIEGNSPSQVDQADQSKLDRLHPSSPGRTAEARGSQSDRVNVSADARLAEEAVKAAGEAPDVRQDAVARARAKLDAGELGTDLHRLADRLIDDLLSR